MGESRVTNWAGVPRDDLPQILPLVGHLILEALDTTLGEDSFNEVVEKLSTGNLQMWVIGDEDDLNILGVLLTRVQVCERTKLLNVYLCSGEAFDSWTTHLEMLEEWGREQGCEYITATGRKGWIKKLKPFGFVEKYVTLYKPLFRSH